MVPSTTVPTHREGTPIAIATFIAGQFSATYNAVSTSLSKDGYRITHAMSAQAIDQSDTYGDALLDFVYRGGQVRVGFTALAAASGVNCLWPFGASQWVLSAAATPIGRLGSDIALAFVMTATANTPASASPATLTATKAIIPPGFNTEILYDSRLREVPVQLQFLPVNSAGTVTWATAT